MVIVNLTLRGFVTRVREKFLKFDFDRLSELIEASTTLTNCLSVYLG